MKSSVFVCLLFLVSATFGCKNPDKPLPKKPNILFAIADDASFPHMGAYGTSWVTTPAFDRIAAEGILFTNAYTPNAKCAPSRSVILTGRNPWQLEEAANHVPFFPEKFLSFIEVLGDNGYYTGFTGKGWAPGNPGERDGKPRELTGPRFQKFSLNPPTSAISGNDYAKNFENFLEEQTDDEPFFFWYGSTEPHRAYEFQSGVNKAGKKLTDIEVVPGFWPDIDSVRHDMLDYALEIEYFDHHLQQMIDILEKRGELENTLIIVTSDNGMPFPRAKGNAYEWSHHLPFAVMWPAGIKHPGRTVDDFISFIDIAPTVLELAEIAPDEVGMPEITGNSLWGILNSDISGRVEKNRSAIIIGQERHDVGRPNDVGYPIRGIITDDYIYLHNFEIDRWPAGNPETGYLNTDGSPTKTVILNRRKVAGSEFFWAESFGKRPTEELYLKKTDPECRNNLSLHPEHQSAKEALKNQLFDQLRAEGDPRMFGRGNVFDEYPYAESKTANFYSKYLKGETPTANWVNETDFETEPLD
jgi:arylsulfatase A-like enzyme